MTAATLRAILVEQLEGATKLVTDDARQYWHMHRDFDHEVVNYQAGEVCAGDAHTNTVEGYFSILKRGITGVYHHVSAQHLKRYLPEFDFRYNERSALNVTDAERAKKAVAGVVGKRMTYQQSPSRPGRSSGLFIAWHEILISFANRRRLSFPFLEDDP